MNNGYLQGQDGSSRTYYNWKTDLPVEGDIVLVHGYAEHSGRYAEAAEHLNTAGFNVWAMDHYGHGLSDGHRADVKDFRLFSQDLQLFIQTTVKPQQQQSLFVYGHSMGGAVSLLYALEHQSEVTGLILSGPMVRPGALTSKLERRAVHFLRKIVPSLPFRPFSAELLSHDPEEVQKYKNDPLNYTGKLKVRLGDELLRMEDYLSDSALNSLSLPVLLLHGGEDEVVPPENSKVILDRIQSTDKTRIVFPGLYHEIHKEAERESVFSTIIDWVEARS
ncbi:MAG: lysophospholipase [Spirochaetia bacterium]|nr:lysophospholipase [Spirochaetia bacterium]